MFKHNVWRAMDSLLSVVTLFPAAIGSHSPSCFWMMMFSVHFWLPHPSLATYSQIHQKLKTQIYTQAQYWAGKKPVIKDTTQ